MHWTWLGRYDEREDETIVDAGTYWTVTPDWPIEEYSERTTVVVAEVEVLEDCPAAELRYRVRRLQRHDGLTLLEADREAYEGSEWVREAEVYRTRHEALSAAREHHRAAVARSIEESAGRAAERLLQVMWLYRHGRGGPRWLVECPQCEASYVQDGDKPDRCGACGTREHQKETRFHARRNSSARRPVVRLHRQGAA